MFKSGEVTPILSIQHFDPLLWLPILSIARQDQSFSISINFEAASTLTRQKEARLT
jgi:hypothetical protein